MNVASRIQQLNYLLNGTLRAIYIIHNCKENCLQLIYYLIYLQLIYIL